MRTVKAWALLTGVVVALGAPGVAAQDTGSAVLTGLVYDSTAMSVLEGARLAVLGTSVQGVSDAEGRFRLESIPPGSYWVSFFHPRLQTLGVSPPSRQIAFEPNVLVDVALAIPSERTLLIGWCLAEQRGSGQGAIAGIVTDSLTGVPLPRAIVRASPARPTPGVRPVEVRTDDTGYYRICEAPGGVDLRLQAHFGQSSGRSVVMSVPAGGAETRDLMLLMSAEGTLTGYVRDYVSSGPIQGASVTAIGTNRSTLTNAEGFFLLDGLPPGRHLVTTDHLAYEARTDSVTVFSQETVDIEVRMAQEALDIEGLVVTARTRFGRTAIVGDDKRADYITREEIEVLLPRVTATVDLLRNVNAPGLRIRDIYTTDERTGVTQPSLCIEVSRRSGGEGCRPAAVFINDVPVPFPDEFMRDLDPNIIDRIEVLTPIDAQFRFGTSAGNGAIVIYTRGN